MDILSGIQWRYRLYLEPHLLLHENLKGAINRKRRNFLLMRRKAPTCYVFADATNVGDRVSTLGVQFLAKELGVELFASPAGMASTFRALEWLEKNRPGTRIVIGGGGLLQECFTPFWSGLLGISLPFALFGVGANEIPGKRKLPPRQLLRSIAHRAVAIHVRDNWTRELLHHGQRAEVTTGVCPAVNYLASRFARGAERDALLYVQHPVDIKMAGGDAEHLAQTVRSLASLLGLRYDEADHVKEDLEGLVQRYQRARYVVSSRLHGCIFSFALGTPFVPILCDRKIAEFVGTHLPDNPCVGVDVTAQTLLANLRLAGAQHRPDLKTPLEHNVAAMQDLLSKFQDYEK